MAIGVHRVQLLLHTMHLHSIPEVHLGVCGCCEDKRFALRTLGYRALPRPGLHMSRWMACICGSTWRPAPPAQLEPSPTVAADPSSWATCPSQRRFYQMIRAVLIGADSCCISRQSLHSWSPLCSAMPDRTRTSCSFSLTLRWTRSWQTRSPQCAWCAQSLRLCMVKHA